MAKREKIAAGYTTPHANVTGVGEVKETKVDHENNQ